LCDGWAFGRASLIVHIRIDILEVTKKEETGDRDLSIFKRR
jgi:hypothetical protein